MVGVDGGRGQLDAGRLLAEEHEAAEVRAQRVDGDEVEGRGLRQRAHDAQPGEGLVGEETEERERGVLHLHHVHEVPRALLARCEAAQDSELLSRGHRRREEQPVHPLPPTWEYHIYLPAFGTGSEGGVERAQRGTAAGAPERDEGEGGELRVEDVNFLAEERGRQEDTLAVLQTDARGTQLEAAVCR